MKEIYKNYTTTQFDLAQVSFTKESIKRSFTLLNHYYEKFLPKNTSAKILDVGCGFGRIVYWLSEKGYSDVAGVDLSESQTKLAADIGIENVTYGNALTYLESSKSNYEMIIAIDFLEHLSKDEGLQFLELVYEKLNKGGSLLLQYPNPEGIHFNSIYFGDVTHKAAYTDKAIFQLGKLANFKTIQVYPVRPARIKLTGKIRHFLWRFRERLSAFWMTVERGKSTKYFTSNIIVEMRKTD